VFSLLSFANRLKIIINQNNIVRHRQIDAKTEIHFFGLMFSSWILIISSSSSSPQFNLLLMECMICFSGASTVL
jgi:hypothetical protein